jgi:hypothetical protein
MNPKSFDLKKKLAEFAPTTPKRFRPDTAAPPKKPGIKDPPSSVTDGMLKKNINTTPSRTPNLGHANRSDIEPSGNHDPIHRLSLNPRNAQVLAKKKQDTQQSRILNSGKNSPINSRKFGSGTPKLLSNYTPIMPPPQNARTPTYSRHDASLYSRFNTSIQKKILESSTTPKKDPNPARSPNQLPQTGEPKSFYLKNQISTSYDKKPRDLENSNKYIYLDLSNNKQDLVLKNSPRSPQINPRSSIANKSHDSALSTIHAAKRTYHIDLKARALRQNPSLTPNLPFPKTEALFAKAHQILHPQPLNNHTPKIAATTAANSPMRDSGPFRKTYGNDTNPRMSYGGSRRDQPTIAKEHDWSIGRHGSRSPGVNGTPPRDGDMLGLSFERGNEAEGWRGRYLDIKGKVGAGDGEALETLKGLLKEKDRENSNLLEEIYKLNGEVGRVSREMAGKDESYDELLRLRDNLMEANTN